jgi:5-methylcytosine-specific restriction endonuclease McrA
MISELTKNKMSAAHLGHQPYLKGTTIHERKLCKCVCGCGKDIWNYDKKSRPKHYIKGHGRRGKLYVEKRPCFTCGKMIGGGHTHLKQRFCSTKCSGVAKQNRIFPNCEFCGKQFKEYPSSIKIGIGRFCSHSCAGKSRTGKRNHQWRGGKSFEPYTPDFNNSLKQIIRTRDKNKCKICGVPSEECYQMDVHHIDYNKKNSLASNLVLLCQSCHSKTTSNRGKWYEYFTSPSYSYS